MADRPQVNGWNNINLNKPEEYSSEFVIDGNRYANVTNVTTGQRQLYFVQPVSNARGLLTTTNAEGTITRGGNYDNFNQFNPGKLASAEAASKQASVKLLSTPGISTPAETAAIKNSKEFKSTTAGQNSASGSGTSNPAPAGQAGTPPTPNQAKAIGEENVYKKGTREKYNLDMRYPENLSLSQDVIKFSILKYSPSLAKENQTQGSGQFGSTKSRVVTLKGDGGDYPVIVKSERIGGITLPIPAGISDSNPVGWQEDTLSMLQSELSSTVLGFFEGGVAGTGAAINQTADQTKAATASGELQTTVKSIFLNSAIGNASASKRSFGAVFNNNSELLFSGPSLRQFSFTFYFYPRRKEEAIIVKKIIRAFKQAMSVKRSATSLLLKSPHTFAIQYLTSKNGKAVAHPYLNRFKECALTSCNVDYTPDGTYMTYNGPEKSMTAYRLSLSFSELEPLFDDEYGSDDDNVGF